MAQKSKAKEKKEPSKGPNLPKTSIEMMIVLKTFISNTPPHFRCFCISDFLPLSFFISFLFLNIPALGMDLHSTQDVCSYLQNVLPRGDPLREKLSVPPHSTEAAFYSYPIRFYLRTRWLHSLFIDLVVFWPHLQHSPFSMLQPSPSTVIVLS